MQTTYSKILSSERFRNSRVDNRSLDIEAESDRGRLLFCPAFRRLQQKAQVFSMEPNAAVRSRLTHSFEVSQMGRYIADQVSESLRENKIITADQSSAFVTFIETACLMHDIGNPPFGHFGESAISEWFRKNGADSLIKSCSNRDHNSGLGKKDPRIIKATSDFLQFDGNPQGLRVASKLQRNSDEFGLNLTKTTLASYIKYVRCCTQKPEDIDSPFTKKGGYFSTEEDLVKSIWEDFEFEKPQRFPLAYIMEAADDIAYCISDLEDSIEKGLVEKKPSLEKIYLDWKERLAQEGHIKEEQTENKIHEIFQNAIRGCREDKTEFTYIDFRTSLNRVLATYSANQYMENHDKVIKGSFPSLIPSDSPSGKVLEALKYFCRSNVYCHESVQKIELAGYTAIYGLMDHFRCLLDCDYNRFYCALDYSKNKDGNNNPIIIEKKLLSLFPKNYIRTYKEDRSKLDQKDDEFKFKEWNLRAHLVTDFISGMTDNFSTETYQTLSGMRL
ncbi:dGTPase [Halomonas salinarum]|uniref:dGTPase n=1 Tax=Halomonas salinarum TaxID=1158993 RepID=UPI00143A89F9|nr:dGTPase [Halomonas salinarum]